MDEEEIVDFCPLCEAIHFNKNGAHGSPEDAYWWQCVNCTFANPSEIGTSECVTHEKCVIHTCEMCDSQRHVVMLPSQNRDLPSPMSARQQGFESRTSDTHQHGEENCYCFMWNCKNCTFANHPALAECEICEFRKDSDVMEPGGSNNANPSQPAQHAQRNETLARNPTLEYFAVEQNSDVMEPGGSNNANPSQPVQPAPSTRPKRLLAPNGNETLARNRTLDSFAVAQNSGEDPEKLRKKRLRSAFACGDEGSHSPERNVKMKPNIECGICYTGFDELSNSESLMSTICGHVFCGTCLKQTVKKFALCPTCRTPIGKKDYHPIFLL